MAIDIETILPKGASGTVGSVTGAIIRAGLNTAPFTGGIASIWSEWDTNRRFLRLEECLQEMSRVVEGLPKPAEPHTFGEAECQLLEEVSERVQREHRQEKRLEFGRLLASSIIHVEVPFQERLRFVRALDEFDEVHVTTLRVLRDQTRNGEAVRFTNLGSVVMGKHIGDEETEAVFIPVLNALVAAYGFVFRRTPAAKGAMGAGSLSPESLAKRCEYIIRPLGLRFLEFLEPPHSAENLK